MGEPGQQLPPCPHCRAPHPEELLLCPNTNRVLPLEGRVLDNRFRFIRMLGEGGMSTVWMAENFRVRKRVAIKLMHPEFARNPRTLHRFQNEATAAGRIGNPHICDILDLGESPLGPYIVMEMLQGQSFAELLETQGRIDPPLAVLIICEALKGLVAAHAAGIIHRDLKPENVFLHEPEPGRMLVKLMDFGISKFTEDTGGGRTGANVVMGTPEYMSPEQAAGAANVDARTDIWAMGVMLYRALTGIEPFRGKTMAALLLALSTEDPDPISNYLPTVQPGLAAVVDRCLAKEAEYRYPSAEAMLAALRPYQLAVAEGERPQAPVRTGSTMAMPLAKIAAAAEAAQAQRASMIDPRAPTDAHVAISPAPAPTHAPASSSSHAGPPHAATSSDPSGRLAVNTWSSEISNSAPDQSWSMGVRTFSDDEARPYTPSTQQRRGWVGWVVGFGLLALLGGSTAAAWYAGLFDAPTHGQTETDTDTGEAEPVGATGETAPPDLPSTPSTTGDSGQTTTTTGTTGTDTGADTNASTTGEPSSTTGTPSSTGEEPASTTDDDAGQGDNDDGGNDTGGTTKPKPPDMSNLIQVGSLYTHKSRGPNGNWNTANEYCRSLKRKKRHNLTKWRMASVAELQQFRDTEVDRLLYWSSESSDGKAKTLLMMSGVVGERSVGDLSPRAFCVSKR